MNEYDEPPIISLGKEGRIEELEILVPSLKPDDLNVKNYFGWTALRLAANNGHLSCIQLLLRHGAEFDNDDIKGQTPLFSAVTAGHTDIVRTLLRAGANPNGSHNNRSCPLALAIVHNHYDIAKELLEYGADVDCLGGKLSRIPSSPVNAALTYRRLGILKTLLFYGATVNYEGVFDPLPPPPWKILLEKNHPLVYYRLLYEFGCKYDESILRECEEVISKSCESLKDTVLYNLRNPRSLKSFSRLVIFNRLPKPPHRHVGKLDLPNLLRQYLTFSEFEEKNTVM